MIITEPVAVLRPARLLIVMPSLLAIALCYLTVDAGAATGILGGQLYGTGGNVTVEVLPSDANDTSELRLCSPGPERFIGTNREVGKRVDLGPFASGTELIFCILNRVSGDKFFMGPASRNPDNIPHAIVEMTGPGEAIVGFEDVFGGFDRDYNDNRFKFTGVIPVPNSPPVAEDDYFETSEDVPLLVEHPGILANDQDANGDSLTVQLISEPAQGTLALSPDGSFVFEPEEDVSGLQFFTYRASDGMVDSNVATVEIMVLPVNDPPTARNDFYQTNEDVALVVAVPGVVGNDEDVDGDELSAILEQGPSHGELSLGSDGSVLYEPELNFFGTDVFTYRVNDGLLDSNVATVTVEVLPINDPPTCDDVVASQTSLWPPNHRMVQVAITGGRDVEGDLLSLTVTAVTQDEPVDGLGDGSSTPDALTAEEDYVVWLRAERSGGGDGRVYAVSFLVSDGQPAGSCGGTVEVSVPHSQRGHAAVDSGQNYNSL